MIDSLHLFHFQFIFASWRDNTTAVTHRCLMQLKSRIVGAGAGRRSRRSWTLAPSHTRLKWLKYPVFPWGKKGEASDLLGPPPRRIAHHQSTRRAAASRAKTKWLERLATRASDLVGLPRVRGSFSESSARRSAAAPVG